MVDYFYNKITLEYSHSKASEIDPRETKIQGKKVYFKLPNCTNQLPLKKKSGLAIVFDKDTKKWKYVPDLRGKRYFLPGDNNEYKITELNETLPENYLEKKDIGLVREGLWSFVEGLRENKIVDLITYEGKKYRVIASSIRSMEEVVSELQDTDEITWKYVKEDGTKEKIVLTCQDIKNILKSFRLRKQLMYKASWLVEDEIYTNPDPKSLDLVTLYDAKITEASSS